MIDRAILLAVGLSLALGCGRGSHPTVRQVSLSEGEKSMASTPPPSSKEGEAICPGSPSPHRIRPKFDARVHSRVADGAQSGANSPTDSRQAGRGLPQIGDANRTKAVDAVVPYEVGEGVRTLLGIVPLVAPGFAGIGLGQELWDPKVIAGMREALAASPAATGATNPAKIAAPSPPGVGDARRDRIKANPAGNSATKSTEVAASNSAAIRDTHAARVEVSKVSKEHATRGAKTLRRDLSGIDSKEVRMGSVRLVAPQTWVRERAPLDFVLAQFILPRAKGDPSDAELTVAPAGVKGPKGLQRLREELNETPNDGSVERLQIGGNEVVVVDSTETEGTDDDGSPRGPSPSPATEGRSRILNAIVFLGDKGYFVTCTGPEKTVSARAGEFRDFLQTMKPVD